MCRNIKTLYNFEPPATHDEIRASALQFVRKLSGFNAPSKANEAAFELAVQQVSDAARTSTRARRSPFFTSLPRSTNVSSTRPFVLAARSVCFCPRSVPVSASERGIGSVRTSTVSTRPGSR